jgi:hypothetical protein
MIGRLFTYSVKTTASKAAILAGAAVPAVPVSTMDARNAKALPEE